MRFGLSGLFPVFMNAINKFNLGIELISGLYDKNRYDIVKKKMNLAVEKIILENVLQNITSEKEKVAFFKEYKNIVENENKL